MNKDKKGSHGVVHEDPFLGIKEKRTGAFRRLSGPFLGKWI